MDRIPMRDQEIPAAKLDGLPCRNWDFSPWSSTLRHIPVLIACGWIHLGVAADDLPRRNPGETLSDLEPQLIPIPVPSSGAREEVAAIAAADLSPAEAVQQLTQALEQARKLAAWSQRLFAAGILAKVDAEKRALKVVQVTMELAKAQLRLAQEAADTVREKFKQASATQAEVDRVESALLNASAEASSCALAWTNAQIAAAELNVQRHRQLMAAGVGSKTQLRRAEERLAELKRPAQP